jgi:hypothetical protein
MPEAITTNRLAALRYLRLIAGAHPGDRYIEVRHRAGTGMAQDFHPAGRLAGVADTLVDIAEATDVYVGVLLRDRKSGTAASVSRSHVLWIESDSPAAAGRLENFGLPPSMMIASGSPGHLHAYWQLRQPLPADQVKAHNRALARGLGADLAATDPARVLRPPGTLNHKHDPAQAVQLLSSDPQRRYSVEALMAALPPDALQVVPAPASAQAEPGDRLGDDRLLLAIAAADYVQRLIGAEPDTAGKIACPFHQDRTPSCQLYPDGSWYCFGACQAGGSIYDFAGRLWGLNTKGREFIELRQRLLSELLSIDPPPAA